MAILTAIHDNRLPARNAASSFVRNKIAPVTSLGSPKCLMACCAQVERFLLFRLRRDCRNIRQFGHTEEIPAKQPTSSFLYPASSCAGHLYRLGCEWQGEVESRTPSVVRRCPHPTTMRLDNRTADGAAVIGNPLVHRYFSAFAASMICSGRARTR